MCAVLMNITRDTIVAKEPRSALTFLERAQGLLGSKSMRSEEALFIPRCCSIHTFFMKFNIDVAFVNAENKVVKIVCDLRPFRLLWGPWDAKGVWELKSGALKGKLSLGETVCMVEGSN